MVTEIMGPAGGLHVDDGGSGGLPVVFIHSFAGSAEHWTGQLDHLRRRRRAVALDLRARPGDAGVYEYACHEGNYGLQHMLEVSRLLDTVPRK